MAAFRLNGQTQEALKVFLVCRNAQCGGFDRALLFNN